MRYFILSLFLVLLFTPTLLASEGVGSLSMVTQVENNPNGDDDDQTEEDTEIEESVLSRMKTRMSFTRREMSRISDPRIRDLYWYALNDTTDKKRYLRVHYAFNEWGDNWSIEFRAGVQGVSMMDTKERFSLGPQMEIGFKKDIHPYWAVRMDGHYSHYSHELYTAHQSTMCSDWGKYTGGQCWFPIEYSTLGVRGAFSLNIMNLIAGRELIYSPINLYAYGGAGFAYSYKSLGERDGSCLVPQWFFGAGSGWNFNQRLSLILETNLSWQGDDLEGFSTQCSTWKYAMTLGLSYKFSKMIHFQRIGYDENMDRNLVADRGNKEEDVLESLIERGGKKTQTDKIPEDMIQAAFFQIDRIELQHTYVLNLGFYARLIISHPQQKFLVKGFADIEVGSMKRNLWLSEQRAKVVADVLVKTYGVNPDQLIVGGGDLDYDIPFLRQEGHHRFNRCTIVCPIEDDYQIIHERNFDDNSELMDGRNIPSGSKQ